MDAMTRTLALRLSRRLCCLSAAFALVLVVCLARAAEPAAAAPEKTDILFVMDTSGSMGGVLAEATEQMKKVIEETRASLGPSTAYGVANLEDVPGYEGGTLTPQTEEEYANDDEKPWRLDQSLTTEESKVVAAIDALTIGSTGDGGTPGSYGGDGPEAYGRALWESDTNPQVGWREGARHEIVVISDNVPHAPNINEGIPSAFQFTEPGTDGFATWPDTGEEPGGKFGIPDTQWQPGESLEFHKVLDKLAVDGKPLAMVDYFHTGESEDENFIHYWETWAKQTGGEAVEAKEGEKEEFAKTLATIVKETTARPLVSCPAGYQRVGEGACAPIPPPPPSPAPIITPPPVPVPLPPPVLGKTVNVELVSGKVFISLPTSGHMSLAAPLETAVESLNKGLHFVPLVEARQIPVGSTLETTAGVARITTATASKGKTQSGEFGAGIFKLLQNRKQKGLTELNIVDNRSYRQVCASVGKKAQAASKHLSSKTLGRLTGSAHGDFTTKGQYSAATVRGTEWGVINQCDGTLTKVTRGEVSVRDFRRRKTITLFTGQSYLAKAPL